MEAGLGLREEHGPALASASHLGRRVWAVGSSHPCPPRLARALPVPHSQDHKDKNVGGLPGPWRGGGADGGCPDLWPFPGLCNQSSRLARGPEAKKPEVALAFARTRTWFCAAARAAQGAAGGCSPPGLSSEQLPAALQP